MKVIEVNNISKIYRLGEIGTGTISHDLNRWFHKVRGKEDPYRLIAQINEREKAAESNYVYALKDINFSVNQGEILGIIGKNGAGKSTLLKILSKITAPTTGEIKYKGRVASLLEVGTGMHPEMTARENIYLNGALLGMTKREIASKFDDIIDFSGCAMYVDTPIKRFSSGMRVRLGFAVAAFLEPEILIVDEVLAVGDAEFQKKAIGKMKEISNNNGRTILFVSHNMASIRSLCTAGLLMENGTLKMAGSIDSIVGEYVNRFNSEQLSGININSGPITINQISVRALNSNEQSFIDENDQVSIEIDFTAQKVTNSFKVTYVLSDSDGTNLFAFSNDEYAFSNGQSKAVCHFPKGFLNVGEYFLSVYFINNDSITILKEDDILHFNVAIGKRKVGGWTGKEPGFIKPKFNWLINDEISN